jgi:hypothetical protein
MCLILPTGAIIYPVLTVTSKYKMPLMAQEEEGEEEAVVEESGEGEESESESESSNDGTRWGTLYSISQQKGHESVTATYECPYCDEYVDVDMAEFTVSNSSGFNVHISFTSADPDANVSMTCDYCGGKFLLF